MTTTHSVVKDILGHSTLVQTVHNLAAVMETKSVVPSSKRSFKGPSFKSAQ